MLKNTRRNNNFCFVYFQIGVKKKKKQPFRQIYWKNAFLITRQHSSGFNTIRTQYFPVARVRFFPYFHRNFSSYYLLFIHKNESRRTVCNTRRDFVCFDTSVGGFIRRGRNYE